MRSIRHSLRRIISHARNSNHAVIQRRNNVPSRAIASISPLARSLFATTNDRSSSLPTPNKDGSRCFATTGSIDERSTFSNRLKTQQANLDAKTLESLLNAEMALLRASTVSSQQQIHVKTTIDSMVDLYNQWWTQFQSEGSDQKRPETSQVFDWLLEACSEHDPRGSQAQKVLEDFDEVLGADVEYKPHRSHYDQVLWALAHDPQSKNTASVGLQIIGLLEEWSFTMKPVLKSHLLACLCVAKDILPLSADIQGKLPEECVQLTRNLQNLLSKIFPLVKETSIGSMDDGDLVLTFQCLGQVMAALSTARSLSSSEAWNDSIVEEAIELWIEILSNDRIRSIYEKRGMSYVDAVETCAHHIRNLPRENAKGKTAWDSFISKVEAVTGKRFVEQDQFGQGTNKGEYEESTRYREEANKQHHLDSAKTVLSTPIGDMDRTSWSLGQKSFMWWISQRSEESVNISMDLLKRFVDETKESEDGVDSLSQFLDENLLNRFVSSWYSVWNRGSIDWTPHRLLLELDEMAIATPKVPGLAITATITSYVLNGMLVRSDLSKATDLVDQLMVHFLDSNHSTREVDSRTSIYLLNNVLNLWSKTDRPDAVQRAESLFHKVQGTEIRKYLDVISCNSLLNVYAKAGLPLEAERLLDTMLQDPSLWKPNIVSVSTVISAWGRSRLTEAPERASLLFERMSNTTDKLGSLGIVPDTVMYNNLLSCWAKSGRKNAGQMAVRILESMNQSLASQADQQTYGIALDACTKAGDPLSAENVLKELCRKYMKEYDERLKPNLIHFKTLMKAWNYSESPDKARKVQSLIDSANDLYKRGVLLEPADVNAYNHLLSAIASSDLQDRAQQADEVLRWMKTQANAGESKLRPDHWSYTFVIGAYLESRQGLQRAEELLSEAYWDEKIPVGIKTIARVILGLAKSDNVDAADTWLHHVFDACEQGTMGNESPSPSLLGGVVASWKRDARNNNEERASSRAKRLVDRMADLHKRGLIRHAPDRKVKVSLKDMKYG